MKLPGSRDAHWRQRCTEEMLHGSIFRRLRDLTATSNHLHVLPVVDSTVVPFEEVAN